MTHFVTERLSTYYERRMLDYANYREPRLLTKKFPSYEGQHIALVSEDIYEVESSKTEELRYTVNVAACLCTCYEGATGKLCKHIHYVVTERNLNTRDNYHLGQNRYLMYFVACGSAPDPGWLDTLHGTPQVEQSAHSVHTATDRSGTVDAIAGHRTDTDVGVSGVQLKLLAKQAEFVELWKEKIDSQSDRSSVELLAAYEAAIAALKKVTTTNAAVSLLHTLGKYSEAGCSKRRKLGNIPVQTTAVARRRKCLRGRAPGEPGRPRKQSVLVSNKHDYSMPMRKLGHAAPHNLKYCVSRNAALGKTHCRK